MGRSRAFWTHFYPLAQRHFPAALGDVSLDAFHFAINDVRPSLIRIEADEATYNLHILIRFELERAMLDGDLQAADLPEAWNEKYRQYLGITPPDNRSGVLQDVHWSAGLIGYFPTYSLGNLYAAQFFGQAEHDLGNLAPSFAKGDFRIDLEHGTVTCPAGQTTSKWQLQRVRTGTRGERVAVKRFEFAAEQCRACPHYRQCASGKRGKGRSVTLHPEEELMQQARAYQETEAFREDTKLRQTAEHRLARLVQLGIRKARYFGRLKTKWQLLLAAAVANLVLVAAWELATGTSPGLGAASFSLLLQLTFFLLLVPSLIGEVRRRQHLVFSALARGRVPQMTGFRPDF